ncbi:hypothetical protein CEXT_253971 [Caerostris extrusa]|uniref:Uncharacterized protein n=1 Tax=Caerostris extrusa TaxID=172846 RepID=A0AAV4XE48_CAEEX|nr:hypothetical protein CEXT_253971 [Caerostris extrusa]
MAGASLLSPCFGKALARTTFFGVNHYSRHSKPRGLRDTGNHGGSNENPVWELKHGSFNVCLFVFSSPGLIPGSGKTG